MTTILGQLVSVSFGRVLTGELMRAAGTVMRHPETSEDIFLFPTAQQLLHRGPIERSYRLSQEEQRSELSRQSSRNGTLDNKERLP